MNVQAAPAPRRCVAVADEGTFTDAAIALGVSQAAVSRTIAALEAELGVRLLRRTTRHVGADRGRGPGHRPGPPRSWPRSPSCSGSSTTAPTSCGSGYAWSALGRHTAAPAAPLGRAASPRAAGVRAVQHADRRAGRRHGRDRGGATARWTTPASPPPRSAPSGATPRWPPTIRGPGAASCGWPSSPGVRVGVDARTGTTTMDLWAPGAGPAALRDTHSVDEWLTLIAAGQAVGMTSEATVAQYPRPGRGLPPGPRRTAGAGLARLVARRPAGAPRRPRPAGARGVRLLDRAILSSARIRARSMGAELEYCAPLRRRLRCRRRRGSGRRSAAFSLARSSGPMRLRACQRLVVEQVGRDQPDDLELQPVRVLAVEALGGAVVGRRRPARRPRLSWRASSLQLVEGVDLPGEVVEPDGAAGRPRLARRRRRSRTGRGRGRWSSRGPAGRRPRGSRPASCRPPGSPARRV